MRNAFILQLLVLSAVVVHVLPLFMMAMLGSGHLLSPDETAVAASARQWGLHGTMRVPLELVEAFPWLHPRSFVTQQAGIVPVGFLGLPMVLGIAWRLLGEMAFAWLVPLLAVSVVYPLSRMTERWHRAARLLTVSVWLTFPMVVMYANRALFPNLVTVCVTIWSAYLLWKQRRALGLLAAGGLLGLAAAIRPVEAVWMIPWLWLAWRAREKQPSDARGTMGWLMLGTLTVGALGMLTAYQTYGNPFVVGYWLRDPARVLQEATDATPTTLHAQWPFGFHPMHMWFNARQYVGGMLAPWTAVMVGGAVLARRERKLWPWIGVGVWTVIALMLLYGQAVYQDHIGVNVVSTGNSFLRYLLPIAPIAALAAGYGAERVSRRWSARSAQRVIAAGAALLLLWGGWTAFFRDDEGVIAMMRERAGYAAMLKTAARVLPTDAIIVSERSDKLFFPEYIVASPLPTMTELDRLMTESNRPVVMYARHLESKDLQVYAAQNILPQELVRGERESLYLLSRAECRTQP